MERNQKSKFETPEIIIKEFNVSDIICTSSIELPPETFDTFTMTFDI